ncbi:hypothetical protein IV102_33220 [bacterium]|nr:hypothetical protein [bacterium]
MRRLAVMVLASVAVAWCDAKPAEFVVAGLGLGLTPPQIVAILGQPSQQNRVTDRLSAWKYSQPSAKLTLSIWNGVLTTIQAQGKWSLQLEGKSLPAYGASTDEVRAAFGPPSETGDALRGKDWWTYQRHNQKLSFHFEGGHVSEFGLTMLELP